MDIFFHAAAGTLLASSLGERRPKWLILAAVAGSLPDLVYGASILVCDITAGARPVLEYNQTHSPLLHGVVFAMLLALNWRIAVGLPLHLLVDAPLHVDSGFYELLHMKNRAFNWYQGRGMAVWAALWAVMLVLIVLHLRSLLRRRAAVRVTTGSSGPRGFANQEQ